MANEIVVGVYESPEEADAARERLIEEGVPDRNIRIEQGPPPDVPMPPQDRAALEQVAKPDEHGLSGFIGRMFSGALLDEGQIDEYADAFRNGRFVVVVHVDSDDRRRTASTILARGGPRIYSLPNAPTAWNEASAGDRASIGSVDDDPARPEGLLRDVEGLPAQGDDTRLANRPRRSRYR
ncbi:MAG TPA: hypothetical protein VKV24_00625 [Casimicrobiaceae bacterium]|nr:hypothetical protein [Casimicrobiaceae bacterium]